MNSKLEWMFFAVGNIPVFFLIGYIFFRSWDRFKEDLIWVLTPDIISLFRGKLAKDWWGEFRFGYFMMACLVTALLESSAIHWLVNNVMR